MRDTKRAQQKAKPAARKTKRKSKNRKIRNDDLHGNAPDQSSVALLLIDVLNDLDFPRNEELVRKSAALAQRIAALKRRCKAAGIPAIYINDNRGKWRSDFNEVIRQCLIPASPGCQMVKQLVPEPDDYIVLKPKHSAFYATPLDVLLEYTGVKVVIIAGLTTHACVMITASDCYVRDLRLFVPSDCVAALSAKEQRNALALMKVNYGANTTPSRSLKLGNLIR
jgi:nicotinamidase-related amidase